MTHVSLQNSLRVAAVMTLLWLVAAGNCALAQPGGATGQGNAVRIAEFQGVVEVLAAGATRWQAAQTNEVLHPYDHVRCGAASRVAFYWTDESVVQAGALTEIEVPPPSPPDTEYGLHLIRGIISFFHRDKPGQIKIFTRGAVAGVEGTEFVLAADDADQTILSVIDGRVRLSNPLGTLSLTNGEQAVAAPGRAPVRAAGFIANNILQWCFYYPAILDPAELPLSAAEQQDFSASLAAYRAGDVTGALAKFPGTGATSDAARVYHAGLLLSVGEAAPAESLLSQVTDQSGRAHRLATALEVLIAAVKRQAAPADFKPELATEYLAESYRQQSLALREMSLERALEAARAAVKRSPQFAFAWERVAELEFCFGRTPAAAALDKSLALAPRNAEALALKGFLQAADNRMRDALSWFDRALAADPALGNAWLGRGLCRIRLGDREDGRKDLLMAAAREPQRAVLRSYLGKADANVGDFPRATKELRLAKELDPEDPTSWLYSALLNQQRSRINDAIRDLEKSKELNDNRSVYRSQLLLDEDRAVRSANLASIYRDAGMTDVSLNEASRAVNEDYGNYSAHLFLADSYANLRDPNEINLRYETPSVSEYLVANLLAPVSAGALSPTISAGEYSKLFQHDGFGVISDTRYLSRGAWEESGAQYGVSGNFSYDFEAYYRTDPGQQVNNDIEQRQLQLTLKGQLTPQDMVYFHVEDYRQTSGDLDQYYDPNQANPNAYQTEKQRPDISVGYHHDWSQGNHTLFYFARVNDTVTSTNASLPTLLTFRPVIGGNPHLTSVWGLNMNEMYTGQLNLYSGELQQILEQPDHTTIVGTRFQYGHFDTQNTQTHPSTAGGIFPPAPTPEAQQDFDTLFQRFSIYAYHQWQIFEPLQLIGGLTYDRILYPENFRMPPLSGSTETSSQLSPKAGLIWTPAKDTTMRFAYTKSLAGASLDQSLVLEPSQVAGFVQSYRSIIPESIAGANAGAKFQTFDLSLEQKFFTGTYLGISGEILDSTVDRVAGAFDFLPPTMMYATPSGLRENLDYTEKTFQFYANQLVGKTWSLGLRYRLSQAVLNDSYPDVPNGLVFNNFQPSQQTKGLLHNVDLTAIYNHPSGFFAEAEALWYAQSNQGYSPDEPGDNFWQFNVYFGYRSPSRRIETAIGLLNLGDQNYNLNPLNIYNDLPRSRTFTWWLRFNF